MMVRLGQLLLLHRVITPQQYQEALNRQRHLGGSLKQALLSLGLVKDEDITSVLSHQYGVPYIDLSDFEVDPALTRIIPAEAARRYQVLPLALIGNTLTIATVDPTNMPALDDIARMTACNIEPVVASERRLRDAIGHYYGPEQPVAT
jgi:type IV pilus assembly protein PilB